MGACAMRKWCACAVTPPDREPQTPTQELDTGPVAAHKTFKNSSVYLDLVDSLGPQSTGLVGAVSTGGREVAVASPSYALGASNVPQCRQSQCTKQGLGREGRERENPRSMALRSKGGRARLTPRVPMLYQPGTERCK
jgi:hypothetical protein